MLNRTHNPRSSVSSSANSPGTSSPLDHRRADPSSAHSGDPSSASVSFAPRTARGVLLRSVAGSRGLGLTSASLAAASQNAGSATSTELPAVSVPQPPVLPLVSPRALMQAAGATGGYEDQWWVRLNRGICASPRHLSSKLAKLLAPSTHPDPHTTTAPPSSAATTESLKHNPKLQGFKALGRTHPTTSSPAPASTPFSTAHPPYTPPQSSAPAPAHAPAPVSVADSAHSRRQHSRSDSMSHLFAPKPPTSTRHKRAAAAELEEEEGEEGEDEEAEESEVKKQQQMSATQRSETGSMSGSTLLNVEALIRPMLPPSNVVFTPDR
jgi:hypothetical protein